MTNLLDIERICVPRTLALEAHEHLRRIGQQGLEGFALWVGTVTARAAHIRATYLPMQQGLRTDEGLLVLVEGDELHRLNRWLYREKLTLIAQLHSHPGEAFHSDTDDAFPIATAAGSLSLVIPDFAAAPFDLARCAVFRLSAQGKWVGLSPDRVAALITIEE